MPKAEFTPCISSSMDTFPSLFISISGQTDIFIFLRAILTPVTSSSIETTPFLLQSPGIIFLAIVGVFTGVCVKVLDCVFIAVGVFV